MNGTIGSTTTTPLAGSDPHTGFIAVQLSGTFVATVTFQGTVDGTNWVSVAALPFATLYDPTTASATATAAGAWRIDASGLVGVRLSTVYTSGTVSWAAETVTG